MKTLPALSFWQPYAWLIVNGIADVDSRTWEPPKTKIGKRIAVHASKKKMTRADYADFVQMMLDLKIKKYPKSSDEFDYGMIIGSVVIDGVTRSSKSYWASPGHFHWILKSARKCAPMAIRGQMGWFSVAVK